MNKSLLWWVTIVYVSTDATIWIKRDVEIDALCRLYAGYMLALCGAHVV
jgi:hypothetical protein